MTVPETSLHGPALRADALLHVERWARERPQAAALLHKRQGRWGLYRWSDVARTLAHLGGALARQGVGPRARMAVSGALEPQLLLLALAAQGAGATVLPIGRHARGAELRALLQAAAPTHAFVQERGTISAWLDSGHAPAAPVPLYSPQPVVHAPGDWRIVPLALLTDDAPAPAPAGAAAPHSLRGQAVLWVDEGTEWAGGLEQVLAQWLQAGAALAAPETSASSARDRREVPAQRALASAQRGRQLQAELEARLPPRGSWTRGLIDRAGSGRGGGPLSAWLLRRIERLHGLPVPARPQDGGAHGAQARGAIA